MMRNEAPARAKTRTGAQRAERPRWFGCCQGLVQQVLRYRHAVDSCVIVCPKQLVKLVVNVFDGHDVPP